MKKQATAVSLRTALWRVALSQLLPLAVLSLIALALTLVDGQSLAALGDSLVNTSELHLLAMSMGPVMGVRHWLADPCIGFYPAALAPGLLLTVAGFMRLRQTSGQVMASIGLWAWTWASWLGMSLNY